VAIKFMGFGTIALDPGWSLLAMHPANRADLPFRLLTAWSTPTGSTRSASTFPRSGATRAFGGRLPRGTPFAPCVPVPRAAPSLRCEAMSPAQVDGYGRLATEILSMPGVYRKRHRAGRADI
jgi:hypothetical protein